MHTLEHIYESDALIVAKEMFRITKHGGFLLISIPYETAYPDPTHVTFYNETKLSNLMKEAGFVPMEVFKDDRFEQKDLLTGLFYKPMNVSIKTQEPGSPSSEISLNAWTSNHNQ
jgi:predicted SAM-dependent methyltransferase